MNIKAMRIIVLLCILSLLITSCNTGKGIKSDTSETDKETTNQIISLKDYTIIRPESGTQTEIDAALLLKSTVFKATGEEMDISTDWTSGSESLNSDDKEIIIGNTNRNETVEFSVGLTRKDYIIQITDTKIVINGGSSVSTYTAVEYFCENYLSYEEGSAVLKNQKNFKMKHEYIFGELDIKIVSLNVLTASNAQVNKQAEREPRIVSFVEKYQPDSIGVQECEIFWRMRLDNVLTGYERAQEITAVTKNYIYYRTAKLKVIDSGVFWLSETPDVSSQGFGSKYYISCCWAIFESLENGSRYVHMNTHLDVNSNVTRESELTLLLPRVINFINEGYAVVLTGDFNSGEETAVYKAVTEAGLASSRYLTPNTSSMPTFNGLIDDASKYKGPIDYCFVNNEVSVSLYNVIDKHDNGFLSDHNALYVEITIYPR